MMLVIEMENVITRIAVDWDMRGKKMLLYTRSIGLTSRNISHTIFPAINFLLNNLLGSNKSSTIKIVPWSFFLRERSDFEYLITDHHVNLPSNTPLREKKKKGRRKS